MKGAVFLVALLITRGLGAQTVAIGSPVSRASSGLTQVFAGTELPDGRLLVTDSRERLLWVIDWSAGAMKVVGRNGAGPLEYQSATELLVTKADTVLMYDAAGRRLLKISPAGTVAGTVPVPSSLYIGSFDPPRDVDAAGRIYSSRRDFVLGPAGGFMLPAMKQLVRWAPDGRVDTIGTVRHHLASQSAEMRLIPMPFSDAWRVSPDGRIVIARADDFGIEWHRNGRLESKGPRVPAAAVRVTAADREGYRKDLASRPAANSGFRGAQPGRGSTPSSSPGLPDDAFPELMPAVHNDRSALFDNEGNLWVRRSRPWGDPAALYDVFNSRGEVIRSVSLERDTRILCFGRGAMYIVRRDADDLEWVERVRR